MTISDATHALASLHQQKGRTASIGPIEDTTPMRLVDAISRVEPTWVEAVAVVQAIATRLEEGRAVPALDDIMISSSGLVSFPPTAPADDTTAVRAAGRLIQSILRSGDCPMPLWESMEIARRTPHAPGTVRGFGASLTCFPPAQGPSELAKYFQAARKVVGHSARPATASFSLAGLTARAGAVALLVALAGIGAGMGVGTIVAVRTSTPAAAAAPAHAPAAASGPRIAVALPAR